jgi:hypothetical protein
VHSCWIFFFLIFLIGLFCFVFVYLIIKLTYVWYKYLYLQSIPAWCKIFIWAIFNDITDIFICCTSVWQSTISYVHVSLFFINRDLRLYWIGALMGERFNELPTPHLSFTALFITWMMYSAFRTFYQFDLVLYT